MVTDKELQELIIKVFMKTKMPLILEALDKDQIKLYQLDYVIQQEYKDFLKELEEKKWKQ